MGSFEELRTVAGVLHPTFKAACMALGLHADSSEWRDCLLEAARELMPKPLRNLLVHIIFNNEPATVLDLWNMPTVFNDDTPTRTLKDDLSDDYRLRRSQALQNRHTLPSESDHNACLWYLEDELRDLSLGQKGCVDYGLPQPQGNRPQGIESSAIADETAYDIHELTALYNEWYAQANVDQKTVLDRINRAMDDIKPEGEIFFLDAPGGTGKTFVLNTFLAKQRSLNRIVVAVASSGIAAILLTGK